jgi:alginate O-acetyltransferase complex protein AlgI
VLFNSYTFIFGFLPITILVFFSLSKFGFFKAATAWLFIASLYFYASWNIAYLPLLLLSIGVNYLIGKNIDRTEQGSKKGKFFLLTGIIFNLALLAYYKYANFFLQSFNQLLGTNSILPEIVLPLGISFYTFNQIAYLVDSYRKVTNQKYNLPTYSIFVSFFAYLTAGPIVHHKDIIPQFQNPNNFVFSHENMVRGLTLFILGLAKKTLIADNIVPYVKPVFQNAADVTFIEAWTGALCYTLQLYFDFSGYSDMAIGLGWMLNINLPWNFNSPYKATSISDFWRRWHITLSNFLRDYLYIPLGGNRQGEIRRYTNLIITMLLGGLWHGAGWTFVIWGGLHGMYLCINHGWRKLNIALPKLLAWAITFICVVFSWVMFRADNLKDGMEILQAMIGGKGIVLPGEPQGIFSWLTALGIQFIPWNELAFLPPTTNYRLSLIMILLAAILLPNTQEIMQWFKPTKWWAIAIGILAAACFLSLNRVAEFLYFQF